MIAAEGQVRPYPIRSWIGAVEGAAGMDEAHGGQHHHHRAGDDQRGAGGLPKPVPGIRWVGRPAESERAAICRTDRLRDEEAERHHRDGGADPGENVRSFAAWSEKLPGMGGGGRWGSG